VADDVGSIYLDVHADTKGLAREIKAAAKVAGQSFGGEFEKGMAPTLSRLGNRVSQEMKKTGALSGREFSKQFQDVIRREARDLDVDIAGALAKGDWGPVLDRFKTIDEATRVIKKRLDQVGNDGAFRNLGIDTNDAHQSLSDYLYEIAKTQAALRSLESEEIDVPVDIDTPPRAEMTARGFLLGRAFGDAFSQGSSSSGGGFLDTFKSRYNEFLTAFPAGVTVIGRYIGVLGGPIATLGSAIGGMLVAAIGSAAFAASGLAAAIGGIGPAAAYSIALAVKSFDYFKTSMPDVAASITGLKDAFTKVDVPAFAQAWGGSLKEFADTLSTSLRFDTVAQNLGEAMASITDAFTAVLQSPAWTGFVDAIEGPLATAFASIGGGLASVMSGVLTLVTAAAPFTQQIAAAFAAWATSWNDMIEAANSSGALTTFFMQARDALFTIVDLALNLTSALGTLFQAGQGPGTAMLGILRDLVGQFNEWMKSADGQSALSVWFNNALVIFKALGPLLAGVGKMFSEMVTPESVSNLVDLLSSLGAIAPILGQVFAAITKADILGVLVDLFGEILGAIKPVLPIIGQLAKALGGALSTVVAGLAPVFAGLIEGISPLIGIVTQLLGIIGPALTPILKAVGTLFAALAPIIQQLGGLIADLLVNAVTTLTPIITALVPVVITVLNAFMPFVRVIFDVANTLLTALQPVIMALLPIISSLAPVIVQVVIALSPFLRIIQVLAPVISPILMLLSGMITWLLKLVAPLIDLIAPIAAVIVQFISGGKAISQIIGWFSKLGPLFTEVARWFSTIAGKIQAFFANLVSRTATAIGNFTSFWITLPAKIINAVASLASKVLTWATGVFTTAMTAFRTGLDKVIAFFGGVPGKIIAAIGSGLSVLATYGGDVVQGFVDGITGAWHVVTDAIDRLIDKIPKAVRKFFHIASPSKLMRELGRYISQGLALGIKDDAGDVQKAVEDIGKAVVKTQTALINEEAKAIIEARKKANDKIRRENQAIQKRNKGRKAGDRQDLRDLLPTISTTEATKIATASTKVVRAALTKMYDNIVKTQSKRSIKVSDLLRIDGTGFKSGLADTKATMADYGVAADYLIHRLGDAKKALADAKKAFADYSKSVADSARSYASALNTDLSVSGSSFQTVKQDMADRLAELKTFRANLAALEKSGISATLLRQITDAGVEQGGALADAILSGGPDAVKEINALQKQIDDAAKGLGNDSAKRFYQAGVDSAQGIVDGIKSKQKELNAAMRSMADALVAEVRKQLKIHSPSKVFEAIGGFIAKGTGLGVTRNATSAISAVRTMSRDMVSAVGTGGGLGYNVSGNVNPAASGGVNVATGAIQIVTPTENPHIVANIVLDRLAMKTA